MKNKETQSKQNANGDCCMRKESDVACFITTAKIPANNPMAEAHEAIAVGLFINYKTGEIVDVSSLYAVACVQEFLKGLLIHRNVHEEPVEDLLWSVQEYMNCSTQKAVCVCIRKAIVAYVQWRSERGFDTSFPGLRMEEN